MPLNSDIFKRRSIRLRGWDYSSPGWYFVTTCTQNRECLFGEIENGGMNLNEIGRMVEESWLTIPTHYPHVETDEFVVMPNHFHGILVIKGPVGAYQHTPQESDLSTQRGAKDFSPLQNEMPDGPTLRSPSKTVGSIIRGFKIGVNKWLKKNTEMDRVWQRNYYEHIIRSERELKQTRQYIRDNPAKWGDDDENPNKQVG